MIFMLFGLLLTGLFYPRIGMPLVPQLIGDIAPLTYFLRISRGIYLKGVGLNSSGAMPWSWCSIPWSLSLLSSKRFKMRLD